MSMTTFSLCPICHARVGKTGHICDIPTPPRGEPVPQTVDSLQSVMAKDAVLMEQQWQEISKLKHKNNQLRQKNAALQQENEALRNEGAHSCNASCTRPICVLRRENEALKDALFGLVGSSDGVYGLHLNGDPCPWEDLLEGGCLEEWLLPFGNPPHD